QNCAWQTYVIVEVSLGLGDPKSSCEHRRSEILCTGLAIAAGDCEDFQAERSPVIGCQRLVCLQRISRPEKNEIVRNIARPVAINQRACGASFCTGFDEIMTVKIIAAQCDEQFTPLNRAGIGVRFVDYDSPVTG